MDFYYINESAPCRSVMLTAKALAVDLNKKIMNVITGEHMNPEFLKINFQHLIPTLVDGDLTLWESRAICTYLISKYGNGDHPLYPKCPNQRALIDRLLFFDFSFLNSLRSYVFPILILGQKPDNSKLVPIQESLGHLNTFLEGHDYAVGNSITVADNCLVATVSSVEAVGIDITSHSNVVAWYERCKTALPGYDTECGVGAKKFGDVVKPKILAQSV